jgi:hypothetical protein
MTITIGLPLLIVIAISVILFIGVTVFCWLGGLFEHDVWGMAFFFRVQLYVIFWILPSLIALTVWALKFHH